MFATPSGGNAVLVIDDDDDVREAMADAVQQLGLSLSESADPSELRVFIMSASAEVPPLPGVLGTLRKPFHFGELKAVLDKYC